MIVFRWSIEMLHESCVLYYTYPYSKRMNRHNTGYCVKTYLGTRVIFFIQDTGVVPADDNIPVPFMGWTIILLYDRFLIPAIQANNEIIGPSFRLVPPFNVEFSNDTGAKIDCTAYGNPMPQIQWYLGNSKHMLYIYVKVYDLIAVNVDDHRCLLIFSSDVTNLDFRGRTRTEPNDSNILSKSNRTF